VHIRHVEVRNFRGIKHLDWKPGGSVVCLVGPGDAGKSTVLDAIEAALSSRWTLSLSDVDFHNADTTSPITVVVTVGGLPNGLTVDEKYGLDLRGWSPAGELHDEPEDDDEPVLTVQLVVDSSLEPSWTVKNNRNGDGRPISAKDREQLGVARIGSDPERHLHWGRGSALSRLTAEMGEVSAVLAQAARHARASLREGQLPALDEAARRAETAIRALGVRLRGRLTPSLSIETLSSTAAAISLHDGAVPLQAVGLGSRRLSALGIQSAVVRSGAILLVDEIEHGLEPHRVRNVVSRLREQAGAAGSLGQVILTTHSPVALVELPAGNIRVMQARSGALSLRAVDSDLQGLVRSFPDALLAKRVLVCEGKTEVGVVRALDRAWERKRGAPLAHQGVAVVNGEGNPKAAGTAIGLLRLGYPVCLLGDDDAPWQPEELAEIRSLGGAVVLWNRGLAIEERVCLDVPTGLLQELLDYGCTHYGRSQALGEVRCRLGEFRSLAQGEIIDHWIAAGVPESEIRSALGRASKSSLSGWFKRTDHGEWLGEVIGRTLPEVPESPLAQRLADVESWCYSS
jgi:predicted ATPase